MATTTPQETTASPIDRHAAPTADTATRSGKATASLIVGIIGVLASLIPILGLILGVVAVALGSAGRNEIRRDARTNKWAATAGLILGAIAIAASIGIFIVNVSAA